jgi:hypothetical protein
MLKRSFDQCSKRSKVYTDFKSARKTSINTYIESTSRELQKTCPGSAQWFLDDEQMQTCSVLQGVAGHKYASQCNAKTYNAMQKFQQKKKLKCETKLGNVSDHLALHAFNNKTKISMLYLDFCGNTRDETILYECLKSFELIRTKRALVAFTFSTRFRVANDQPNLTFKDFISRIEKKMKTIFSARVQCECQIGYRREKADGTGTEGQSMMFCSFFINWHKSVETRYTVRGEPKWIKRKKMFRVNWWGYPNDSTMEPATFKSEDF